MARGIKVKNFDSGWMVRLRTSSFEVRVRYFNSKNGAVVIGEAKRFRVSLDLNTDRLIRVFGFNHKSLEI